MQLTTVTLYFAVIHAAVIVVQLTLALSLMWHLTHALY